jgi:diguanylate cyclase (GGDEF)-like protein
MASRGYVNDLNIRWQHQGRSSAGLSGESQLERLIQQEKIDTLSKVLGGQKVDLRVTHAGRVRMAELEQQFRSGRIREQFGILWDGRQFDQDLRIRLLDASVETTVAVAYLDLNAALKPVNDTWGHNAGNILLQAYFQDVAAGLPDQGDAYRLGGDEVGVILPGASAAAAKAVKQMCVLLMNETLRFGEKPLPPLSVACGMVIASDVGAAAHVLRESAERAMYRAKERTKDMSPRPSSLALENEADIQLFQPPQKLAHLLGSAGGPGF